MFRVLQDSVPQRHVSELGVQNLGFKVSPVVGRLLRSGMGTWILATGIASVGDFLITSVTMRSAQQLYKDFGPED